MDLCSLERCKIGLRQGKFMYTNKCTKCGREFETKNPKRIICPECLYPDKTPLLAQDSTQQGAEIQKEAYPRNYSAGTGNDYKRSYNNNRTNNNYQHPRQDGQRTGNFRPRNNDYQRRDNRQGGFKQNSYSAQGRRPYNNAKRPQRPKQLLVNKEQLAQIEEMYKKCLPLPNPDIHEVIGEAIGLEPRKVFFGINLIRQKMMLPKVSFPKRKLAISPDQMMAIRNLYEPLLPLPPIGCHKIIAAQLKMDEWRVHVGIGLVRKQMGLDRWNPEREDAPAEYKKQKTEE